ncbi:MAG: hypoxanthine phosphoribosyltransferase [Clostridiales bacterium]
MTDDLAEILFTEEDIKNRVEEMAVEISAYYKNIEAGEVVVIGILRGAVIFMSDLIRKMDIPLILDFMSISSYGKGTQSSGNVRIIKDIVEDISDKHVLIIEDIVDSGLTLDKLKKLLYSKNPKSVQLCTFMSKPSRRQVDVEIDYCGYEIPDEYVVGYGLDYAGLYRELPYVAILAPKVYMKAL